MPELRPVRPRVRYIVTAAAVLMALGALSLTQEPADARPASTPSALPPDAFIPFVGATPASTPIEATQTPVPPSAIPTPDAPAPTPPPGPVHVVKDGETLWQIAIWHRVDLSVVLRWNPAVDPSRLVVGARVNVPGGAPMPARTRVRPGAMSAPSPVQSRPAPRMLHRWPLPVRGMITTRFSSAHPGIDIAAPAGTSVRAIASGTVAFAGWKNNGGGYVVVVRHPGGMISTYNHNQSLAVRTGQAVVIGQRIASVGSTGYSTGPHLDLRVEMGGRLVNPLGLY